jgi:predicted RNA binding protein YcfA (HicA-like mRNA interferase family)
LKEKKLLKKILAGSKNISFRDFVSLLQAFGFQLSRTQGSHHIFQHTGIRELINIQNVHGQAKPYQIKQFLELVEKYNLQIGEKQ